MSVLEALGVGNTLKITASNVGDSRVLFSYDCNRSRSIWQLELCLIDYSVDVPKEGRGECDDYCCKTDAASDT